MTERILDWDGCKNVRDLGGLPRRDKGSTNFGALVRGDTPGRLTPAGWAALHGYGIRTIITLRTVGMTEEKLDFVSPYADIVTVQAAIEDVTDLEFREKWASNDLWSTPMYYNDALRKWPARHAAVISAIAQAKPAGVLYHCIRGNDRTGIISLLLLALVGVEPEAILEDYMMSPDPEREELLVANLTSTREVILNVLKGLEVETYLCGGGASPADLAAVRRRLAE